MRNLLAIALIVALGVVGGSADADAASKQKRKKSYKDFTADERAKASREAMAACRKRYGAGVVIRARVDWQKMRYICYTN